MKRTTGRLYADEEKPADYRPPPPTTLYFPRNPTSTTTFSTPALPFLRLYGRRNSPSPRQPFATPCHRNDASPLLSGRLPKSHLATCLFIYQINRNTLKPLRTVLELRRHRRRTPSAFRLKPSFFRRTHPLLCHIHRNNTLTSLHRIFHHSLSRFFFGRHSLVFSLPQPPRYTLPFHVKGRFRGLHTLRRQ